jgi:hypothetical protein
MARNTLFTIPTAPSTFESHYAHIALSTASAESCVRELRATYGKNNPIMTGTHRYSRGETSGDTRLRHAHRLVAVDPYSVGVGEAFSL